ncbi:hypothetical protein J2X90_002131 [Variovorax paradoxus]|uniref:beta strand repeat-containing protein n=1 Tax=Variovorax paradoxus TaxID=34073 RepID=UPI002785159E|nr:hypothetical protein [Variovorax paradoxus]MDQ0024333.1 hypothetical protein [Variovorax paradoxus]
MTTLQNIVASSSALTQLNENFDAVSAAGIYGRRAPAVVGLTWAYYGGRGFGNTVADGTVALTGSTTNYVVASRSTGAVSTSTSITNWNDTTNYFRCYLIVTGAATITTATDYREFTGGAAAGSSMTNPMTTAGDIIYGGTPSGGIAPPTRLAASTNGYVLTLAAGVPTWAAASGGFSNPMTTSGDLILGGSLGAAGRLGIGSDGQVLTVTAGVVGWAASASGFANPMTTVGDLIVGGASGAATRVAAGTAGYVFTSNGAGSAPTWQVSAAGFANPMTTVGDLIVGGTSGAATRVAAGTSGYVLTSNGAGVAPTWQASAGGGVTGFTTSLATSSPNNVTNSSVLLASGGTTNQHIVIQAKGNGSIVAQLADGTATGGNLRGTNGVDFQTLRNAATQVASGVTSAILCGNRNTANGDGVAVLNGFNNTATGTNSIAAGQSSSTGGSATGAVAMGSAASATGAAAIALGASVTASGSNSVALGTTGTAAGDASTSIGDGANARTRGSLAHASGLIATSGDIQVERLVHRRVTTNATPTPLSAANAAPAATTAAVLPNNSCFAFEIVVVGKNTTFGDRASYKITGQIARGANAAATVVDGTPTTTTIAAVGGASAWSVAVSANTSLGSLEVTATGAASTTILWVANITLTEVVG